MKKKKKNPTTTLEKNHNYFRCNPDKRTKVLSAVKSGLRLSSCYLKVLTTQRAGGPLFRIPVPVNRISHCTITMFLHLFPTLHYKCLCSSPPLHLAQWPAPGRCFLDVSWITNSCQCIVSSSGDTNIRNVAPGKGQIIQSGNRVSNSNIRIKYKNRPHRRI